MKHQRSLFDPPVAKGQEGKRPLADRMRPRSLEEFLGQEHLLGEGKVLRHAIEKDQIPSMIFWGPPGVGKTTLARIIAAMTRSRFASFSAVLSGIKEIKELMQEAELSFLREGQRTILFIDEIHRFNKAQQDAFLPFVESGQIVLIGATTENPSFEVISALLSRMKVYVLNSLSQDQITGLLRRALQDEDRGLGLWKVRISEEALERISDFCNGDARMALNALELAASHVFRPGEESDEITAELLQKVLQHKGFLYDKQGEEHFNLISALHKTMRNSDPDAALYWLARMLESGADPLYVARRLVRFASEDVGLADPAALRLAMAAKEAVDFIGLPEGNLALAEAVVYLSVAPKSNSVYTAYSRVRETLETTRNQPVPLHLRNAPTRLMKDLQYGEGYEYAHDLPEKTSGMSGLPDSLEGRSFYRPTEEGLEKRIKERMESLAALRHRLRSSGPGSKQT